MCHIFPFLASYSGTEAAAAAGERETDDEWRWAKECLADDPGAFEKLLARSERVVRGMLMNLTHDTTEADELAQDSFVTAYERLHQFRGDARFSTWVCQIAFNKYRDRRRAMRRETDDGALADMPARAADMPENACLRRERARHLRRALARLTRGDREVLTLRYLCGYDHETLAAILQCTVEAARARCARAQQHLKLVLTNRSDSDEWT